MNIDKSLQCLFSVIAPLGKLRHLLSVLPVHLLLSIIINEISTFYTQIN